MTLRLVASRHSAFYTPFIGAVEFLRRAGIDASYRPMASGETTAALLGQGLADVVQSSVSTNWALMDKGVTDLPLHFALINQRDGFYLVRKGGQSSFSWHELEGRKLLADHGRQPLAMLKFAVLHNGADWGRITLIDAGSPEMMAAAFVSGEGDYVHLQAPGPQLLSESGSGQAVVSVGAAMPPNAFSTVCASRGFIGTTEFHEFTSAFSAAKRWAADTDPREIAAALRQFFPEVNLNSLSAAIESYQKLGTWEGAMEISRALYEQTLDVFEAAGALARRYPWEEICV